jgi:hypothetical protein
MIKYATDYRKDISKYKDLEAKLLKQLVREENKLDENLDKIQNFISRNKELDIEQLVEVVISKCWVTKDKLTQQQLYLSTKDLINDYLVIEAIEDSVETI